MTPSYPVYQSPSVAGISVSINGMPAQPLPPNSLCAEADALIVQKAIGGVLVNAADYPALGMVFAGLNPASPYQPWWIINPTAPGYAGENVALMYGPNQINGGGVGSPGAWVQTSDQWNWEPAAIPAPAPAAPSAPVVIGAALFGVNSQEASASTGGGGSGLTVAQAQQLADALYYLAAMAKMFNITPPVQ